jgi:hypothetical protein
LNEKLLDPISKFDEEMLAVVPIIEMEMVEVLIVMVAVEMPFMFFLTIIRVLLSTERVIEMYFREDFTGKVVMMSARNSESSGFGREI